MRLVSDWCPVCFYSHAPFSDLYFRTFLYFRNFRGLDMFLEKLTHGKSAR